MPLAKVKLGEFADIDAAEGFSDYTGKTPPKGMYRTKVKFWKLVTNSKGDPMFKLLLEIAEKGEKAKFNGYAIWHNANITKVGAPYLNAMLDALQISRSGKIVLSAEKEDRVTKIGGKAVDGLEVLVTCARKRKWGTEPEDDEWELEAKSFAPVGKVAASKSDEDEGDEDEADTSDEDGDTDSDEGDGDEEEDSF